jgi:hypothetical protein
VFVDRIISKMHEHIANIADSWFLVSICGKPCGKDRNMTEQNTILLEILSQDINCDILHYFMKLLH